MEIITVVLIGALILGGFMIFQDYYEIPPYGQFSFAHQFYIGNVIIFGAVIGFGIRYLKRKSTPMT